MTVTSTSSRMPPYAGNGSATAFPVAIPFPDADSIRAILRRPGLADADLVRDTDFTLSGAGDPAGGTLVFPKAGSAYQVLAEGQTLHILRVLPLTQERAWDNVDAIDAGQIEAGNDRLTLIAQQLQEQLDRAVQWPAAGAGETDAEAWLGAAAAARDAALAARSAAEAAQVTALAAQAGAQAAQAAAEDAGSAAADTLGVVVTLESQAGAHQAAAGLAKDGAEQALADTRAERSLALAAISAAEQAAVAAAQGAGDAQEARVILVGDTQVARVVAEGDAQVSRLGATHTHDDRYYTEAEVDAALAGKSNTAHTHAIADTTGLQAALDGKLGTAAQAADSDKLDGMQPDAAASANTIAKRDASGNASFNVINANLLSGTATSARYA